MEKDPTRTKEHNKPEPANRALHEQGKEDDLIQSEKMRYKNADEIYE
ncbi:hypothetical protein [Cytobacillus oceanisediminis]|uniref:Uncharacterized protein n=1 Tax=Cytobacillus oceanisediminis TaxID=665099 RepID=A0A562K5E9_9BACI|nr:hypothetical protein [Cytobacillus oceanisediminis]TWH90668.1 hypothetical protein IQ19_00112 [Cytobacillus oceanisediminis]